MNRWNVLIDLLKDRPHARGAEIGVQAGKTTGHLLAGLPGLQALYGVDLWTLYPDYEQDRVNPGDLWPSQRLLELCRHEFFAVERRHRARTIRLEMDSVWAAEFVPDAFLDFVFIDANHLYGYVRADILAWRPKVRPGGLIIGHDYEFPVPAWGVKRAVDEIFGDAVQIAPEYIWWVQN